MPLNAVLFDHDGTLVDSEGVHCRHWQALLADYGINLSDEDYRTAFAGIPTPANATRLAGEHDLPITAAELAARKDEITKAHLASEAFPLMPGARNALERLYGAGLKIAIVTGAGAHGVRSTIKSHGLGRFVDAIVSGDDVAHSKPAPDCYLLALEQLGIAASDGLALEDTRNGVTAATKAGLVCCAIPNAYSEHHDFTAAQQRFQDFDAAMTWITGHYGIATG